MTIEETKITNGIMEFEKFKAMAAEAIERCRKAEEQANYFRGQNEMLVAQHDGDEARHSLDLARIAELEAFIGSILEQYRSAEEKLRLGHFRRAGSAKAALEPAGYTALEDDIRRTLANQSN